MNVEFPDPFRLKQKCNLLMYAHLQRTVQTELTINRGKQNHGLRNSSQRARLCMIIRERQSGQ